MSVAIFWFCLLWMCCISTPTAQSPHIVFILVDDSGWGDWGYHNNGTGGEIVTPNVDYLAKNGLILNRHYVHYVCAPTRSSIQSGRLPVHCNLSNAPRNQHAGIPPNYTCIATKLKEAKYSTHLVGKWDAGFAVMEQTPNGRGYDTSFGYLMHENDYWTQTANGCNDTVDLWDTNKPAYGQNGTIYEELMFANHVYDIINNHDANTPLFLFYASHIVHKPLEVPHEYYTIYPNDENMCHGTPVYPGFNTSIDNYHCRSIYQSMVNLLDIIIGNITSLLKQNNLWDNTLLIWAGDNGAPENNGGGGNNFPLRGGKYVPFEGGIRTASLVSGGYLPQSRRGKVENGMIHITDWYSTFCGLNGIDPTDTRAAKAGLPPIDSLNVWDLISGKNMTSPRTEIPIDEQTFIQGNYKLINGTTVQYASWGGYVYPNSTTPQSPIGDFYLDCQSNPCLFDVVNDMTEHNNIAKENADIVAKMSKRFNELKKGYYNNTENGKDLCPSNVTEKCLCWMATNTYNGFYGPYATLQK